MKKIVGIFFSFLLFLLILEAGLRTPGSLQAFAQNWLNEYDLADQSQIRILCLGESTTAWGLKESYPKVLERQLRKIYPNKNVVVINAGASGANSTYFKEEISNFLEKYRPHIVTMMLGVNDSWGLEKEEDEGKAAEPKGWLATNFQKTRIYRLFRIARINVKDGISFGKKIAVAPEPPPSRYQNTPPLFAKAATAFDLQDYESAIRLANEQLALPSREFRLESLQILAKAYLALGQMEDSERYFEAAFEENSSIYTFLDASHAAASTEPRTPALKELMARILKRGLERHPQNPSLTVALAEFHADFSDPASAKQWLQRAIELEPKDAGLYLRLGQIYQSEENIPQAEAAYKLAAELPTEIPQDKIRHSMPLLLLKIRYDKISEAEALIEELEKISNVFNPGLENIKKLVRGEISSREITNEEFRPMSSFLRHRETKRNYLSVVSAIKKFGAVPVAVQYPRQSLEQLKELLEYDGGVVFVGNEKNFEEALQAEPYESFFYDNFAENFGHFTPKGSRLVANAILARLKERQILPD